MATMTARNEDIVKFVNDLIELDYDAIDAYSAAIERLEDTSAKSQLRTFMGDHQRHTVELAAFVRDMGGEAATDADFKRVLTKGRVVIGGIMGDRGVLSAMKSNEDDTNEAYEKAVAREGLPSRLQQILQQNLQDERRHRAWIEARLAEQKSEHWRG